MRPLGRNDDAARPIRFTPQFLRRVTGSCLAECGNTRVLCTALVENGVPPWMAGRGEAWLTAEYAMLPASTGQRKAREGRKSSGIDGRTMEIQRLIGRVLRPQLNRKRLGEITITVDCDVLEADGGTRTTAINGAVVAVAHALFERKLERHFRPAAALSVGIVDGRVLLDLEYVEDVRAEADMNIALDEELNYLELQATGEGRSFRPAELEEALRISRKGIAEVLTQIRTACPPGLGRGEA